MRDSHNSDLGKRLAVCYVHDIVHVWTCSTDVWMIPWLTYPVIQCCLQEAGHCAFMIELWGGVAGIDQGVEGVECEWGVGGERWEVWEMWRWQGVGGVGVCTQRGLAGCNNSPRGRRGSWWWGGNNIWSRGETPSPSKPPPLATHEPTWRAGGE